MYLEKDARQPNTFEVPCPIMATHCPNPYHTDLRTCTFPSHIILIFGQLAPKERSYFRSPFPPNVASAPSFMYFPSRRCNIIPLPPLLPITPVQRSHTTFTLPGVSSTIHKGYISLYPVRTWQINRQRMVRPRIGCYHDERRYELGMCDAMR
ncbi:uncharacterized protein EI90DRAFT_3029049 [Cantharellus anzutake]|uniref:uncharacterized protein n=1 Tax=Cantharellus anzutake TaxID=1750568 RepID=UPI0019061F9B|nr:uncharacterized protein EI90DRAFT_3029049 [Cantharellus anzutake]KAF8344279.1 hypothetical protein EI90DRAFT_3029049 [Cantharellus anzutake]